MITKKILEDSIFSAIKKSSCQISPDVHAAFEKAIKSEQAERSKGAFKSTLESLDQSVKVHNLLCPVTGWSLFFCKTGNDAKIEGGILGLEEIAKKMVATAPKEGYLKLFMSRMGLYCIKVFHANQQLLLQAFTVSKFTVQPAPLNH